MSSDFKIPIPLWILTLTLCSCSKTDREVGRLPPEGVHQERIDYVKARQIPGSPIIKIPVMDLDRPETDPPRLHFPQGLTPGFPVAFEGVLKAPSSIPDVEVNIEFHSLGEDGDANADDLPLSQSGVTIGDNENGLIRYRIDLRLPRSPGRHRFRIGAIINPDDTQMVGIAQGILSL